MVTPNAPSCTSVFVVPPGLAELERVAAGRDRFVLAIEMDLDEGDEDAAVRACAGYMTEWLAGTS